MQGEKKYVVKGIAFDTIERAREYIAAEKLDVEPEEVLVIDPAPGMPMVLQGPQVGGLDKEDLRERY